ncbi:hypothetical protein H2248_007195 [Termitomyces sp. 'cryptogamus']|nr:hypothetical protein H2248_007195 [Termitomyces sp. 'cryptogamus']
MIVPIIRFITGAKRSGLSISEAYVSHFTTIHFKNFDRSVNEPAQCTRIISVVCAPVHSFEFIFLTILSMSISAEIIPRAIPGLPSREVLAALCSAHSSEHFKRHRTRLSHFIYRPPKRRNLLSFFKSRGTPEPLALIKFGSHVTLGEARTQIYVFQHLKCDPSPPFRVAEVYDAWEDRLTGFIVMEYIPGLAATAMDGPRIAAAIHWLLALPPPDDGRLGPVGGGPMRHCLWRDDEGPTYESVERMDTQINNVRLFLSSLLIIFDTLNTDIEISRPYSESIR